MKISGFTFMRNTSSLYYPFIESIQSILPLVSEFVIALGDNEPDDLTESMLVHLASDKIRILRTTWDTQKYPNGTIYAQQTDLAKSICTGDWLFYLQSDEVLHEKYHAVIREACINELENIEVEGFLFNYKHFWGDYNHFIKSHAWYPYEIRIIRNDPDIHAYGDAQSFKYIPQFNQRDYRTKSNTRKLNVKLLNVWIYHYGWVRPPDLMQSKNKYMSSVYFNPAEVHLKNTSSDEIFDYGNMNDYQIFNETHPAVMTNFIKRFNWKDQLNFNNSHKLKRKLMKHEKLKYKMVSWIEQKLLNDHLLFGYKNWNIIK
jgi:hypothetical protein